MKKSFNICMFLFTTFSLIACQKRLSTYSSNGFNPVNSLSDISGSSASSHSSEFRNIVSFGYRGKKFFRLIEETYRVDQGSTYEKVPFVEYYDQLFIIFTNTGVEWSENKESWYNKDRSITQMYCVVGDNTYYTYEIDAFFEEKICTKYEIINDNFCVITCDSDAENKTIVRHYCTEDYIEQNGIKLYTGNH